MAAKAGKNALVYTKSGEKWWLNGKEMDSGTVQQFIDKARDAQAAKFLDKASGAPVFDITVTSNEGKRTERVQISKGEAYFARRDNDPAFYALDAKAAQDMMSGAAAIKPASLAKSTK